MSFIVPEKFRFTQRGRWYSDVTFGNNGLFYVPHPNAASSFVLKVIASDGEGWEHVSVSLPTRCPTWTEMSYIKGLFWGEEDCVLQLHPPASQYVNNHPYCLHLWRPVDQTVPTPPGWMVGFKDLGVLT